jgi:hypothetical protein
MTDQVKEDTDRVVEFENCEMATIRRGSEESVNYPNDLDRPVRRIRLLASVQIVPMLWI